MKWGDQKYLLRGDVGRFLRNGKAQKAVDLAPGYAP